MPLALGPGANPNAYVPPYVGAGPIRAGLGEYMRQFFGPDMQIDPNTLNQAAANYYSTPATGDIGGAGAQTAQRSFGDLLTGQAAAANSAAMQNAARKAQAGSGINAAASATGNIIGSQIGAKMALNNAQSQYGMQNLGLLSSLIGSFASPTGSGTNLVNAFTGQAGGPSGTSGLGQGVTGAGNFLSSLIWPTATSGIGAGGAPFAADAASFDLSGGGAAGGGLMGWLSGLFGGGAAAGGAAGGADALASLAPLAAA
jgi:hypothetical protein